jgi:hypothetical protein
MVRQCLGYASGQASSEARSARPADHYEVLDENNDEFEDYWAECASANLAAISSAHSDSDNGQLEATELVAGK